MNAFWAIVHLLDVLARYDEKLEHSYQLSAKGVDLPALTHYVAMLLELNPEQLLKMGRYPIVVQARSLLCNWAVRELGITATELAKKMGRTQPSISISDKCGEITAQENAFSLKPLLV